MHKVFTKTIIVALISLNIRRFILLAVGEKEKEIAKY